jgi:outer membrane protein
VRVLAIFMLFAAAGVAQSAPPSRLTLQDAEQIALRNNPSINIARLTVLAQAENARAARSAELPTITANFTAVKPHDGTRIAAGGLNNPLILERASGGVNISQLFYDFGRTRHLNESAQLQQQSARTAQQATADEIKLAVDEAFYRALSTDALVHVADQTVAARQNTADQVSALAKAKLKSDLDLSFANVNLAQAQLLQVDARNAAADSIANLNSLLGYEQPVTYTLVDSGMQTMLDVPDNAEALVKEAMNSRPDLAALEQQYESAQRFAQAEHELERPSISGLASFGGTPVRVDQLTPWYGAAGVNLSIPVFNGGLFSARAREADYRSQEQQQRVLDLRSRIARDVRTTVLNLQAAAQRMQVTDQLLRQANMALDLAQTRYRLGLSSIVELGQAQLQQTEAAIGSTNARYAYQQAQAELRFQTGR